MKLNNWINASQATELLAKQLVTWPLAKDNYNALKGVLTKSFEMDGFTIRVQFNPARIISTGAKIDASHIKNRKCFLCLDNLPIEQERLSFGYHHLLLCNPYPIFPQHFTIPTRQHTPQRILPQLDDFLTIVKKLSPLTVFYNGPRSGASAPDHAHFQAVTREIMPLDYEIETKVKQSGFGSKENKIILLSNYLRNGFIIQASTQNAANELFHAIYERLPLQEGENEPMMNVFGSFSNDRWIITIIPRKQHRPWQYSAEEEDNLLSSPGAADIGGLFITPLKKDFDKITPHILKDVYQQVCFDSQMIEEIFRTFVI